MLKLIACGTITSDANFVSNNKNDGTTGYRSSFSVAVNRHAKTKDDAAIFINVTLWDNQAKNMHQYLKKGTRVTLEGDFIPSTFTKQDGTTQTNLQMSSPSIEIQSNQPQAKAQPVQQEAPAEEEPAPEFTQVEEDDLPF